MTKIVTNNHKLNIANQLLESINEPANNMYYVFVGDHVTRSNTPELVEDVRTVLTDAYRNMIFGKKVAPNTASIMIRNVGYSVDTSYDMYDDTVDLSDKDFYVIVDETSLFHVYKCLDNNLGGNSTIEPQFSYVSGANNYVFETADGYKWKYMYSVTDSVADFFSTASYFPVVSNTTVEAAAAKGAIDVIAIDGEGRRYDNYMNGTFTGSDIRIGGDVTLYKVSNTDMSYANGFYTGCLIYLSSGTGVGQFRTIEDYFVNGNGNFIVLESGFTTSPVNGTTYQIRPKVEIVGSGVGLVNATARALVNSTSSNSIWKVEMLEVGANYEYATANVIANSVVGVSQPAIVRPVYSPLGGHGANSAAELLASTIVFSAKFQNTESNTILTANKYQTIGLLKDPKFANVDIQMANNDGTYLVGEKVCVIDPIRLNTNLNINTSSGLVSSIAATLTNILIVSGGTSGSYVPGEILTVQNGTPIIAATMNVVATEVSTVTIANAGSGYTNGDTISLTSSGGTNATFTVTTNSTGFGASLAISDRGYYITNPTLANSATTGGGGTGLRVTSTMRIANVAILNAGVYAVVPGNAANNRPTGGSGTGAEFTLTFTTSGLADFSGQVTAGDYVYLTDSANTEHQLGVVNNVVNATHFYLTTNGAFACSAAWLYMPNFGANSYHKETVNTTNILLSNVDGELSTGQYIIALNSGAISTINSISRGGDSKTFNTFIGLYKYKVSIVSGTFTEDEQVYQGTSITNSTANAYLHSVLDVSGQKFIYTSNQIGTFTTDSTIVGANSGAIATLTDSYSPEIEFGSGEVLYLENIEAVTRSANQSEQFKLIFTL